MLPTRQSLLSRLKDWRDEDSWKTFFETYWKLIYHAAVRAGLSDTEAQDVVQETVIRVSKSMKNFKYRQENGSFKAWLLRLTRWRINDQFKKRQKSVVPMGDVGDSAGELEDELAAMSAGEMGKELMDRVSEESWDTEWESNLLEAALGRVKRRVDPRHYQVFHLIVLKEEPVADVSRALKIGRAKIYVIKHRLSNLLKKEIEYLRTKPV